MGVMTLVCLDFTSDLFPRFRSGEEMLVYVRHRCDLRSKGGV